MGCISCPKWVISEFQCLNCFIEFTLKHRDKGSPVTQAERKGTRCPNCQKKNYKYLRTDEI